MAKKQPNNIIVVFSDGVVAIDGQPRVLENMPKRPVKDVAIIRWFTEHGQYEFDSSVSGKPDIKNFDDFEIMLPFIEGWIASAPLEFGAAPRVGKGHATVDKPGSINK